jgi:hypothetical protein
MDIQEMHVMFRQYAQQMGMQNVRAILPEQIDLLINNSINDTINQIVTQNIGITNDRVITDNSKLNQVNALKSLYKVWNGTVTFGDSKTSYIISYELPLLGFKSAGTYLNDNVKETAIQYIYIVDLSLDYNDTKNQFTTNIFPIRIIDDMYLADVVNDFILHPTLRSPVATIHDNNIELYIDKADAGGSKSNHTFKGLKPNKLRLSYIAKPAVVKFLDDVGGTSVDCDLPEYLHVDIVKHAVELYRTAVTGSIAVTQQAQEAQQRENLRNNYRQSDNDNSNR